MTDFCASSSHDVYHAFSKCRALTRQFLPREWQTMLGLHPSFAYRGCCKLKPALQVCHGFGVTCRGCRLRGANFRETDRERLFAMRHLLLAVLLVAMTGCGPDTKPEAQADNAGENNHAQGTYGICLQREFQPGWQNASPREAETTQSSCGTRPRARNSTRSRGIGIRSAA